jgi:diguanylate cyclase (GGDEF)-like protein/PAS domain S-box-containing protein/putative nucleotidyltransferase with HDIG domain
VTRRPQSWLVIAALAAMLIATGLAVVAAVNREGDAARDRRALVAGPAIRALAAEVAVSTASLDDLRAFHESSDRVTAEDFTRFTAAPLQRQTSLMYLAWTPEPSPADAGGGLVAGEEPTPGAAHALLADAATADVRAAARDMGRPRMTPPLGGPDGPTALLVAPVYSPGAPLRTVEQRRAALRGWVSGMLRLTRLGGIAREGLPEGVGLVVRDGGATVTGAGGAGDPEGTIAVAGRLWTVSLPGLGGPSRLLPVGVGVAGLGLTALVALLFRASANRERTARRELEGLRVRHDLILGSAGDGIVGLDDDVRVTFVNPAAADALGWDIDDLTGGRFDELVLPALGAAVRGGRPLTGEGPVRRRDGTSFVGEYAATPLSEGDVARGAVVVFRDVTARAEEARRTRESLAAAEELAAIDALTGLANHRTFHDRLRIELERARRHGRGLSLVLMDLDHFKQVNDRYGHQVGDRVLRHAARVFEEETRTGELVARVGGEEFAMILPEADGEEAFRAAERVRRAVGAATFPEVGHMTMSAGVCDLPHAGDADTLYRLADGALYWAKHSGRDMVLRYTPDMVRSRPAPARTDDDVTDAAAERRQALVSMRLLARVVDAKDPSTRRHSERVADLAAEIAVKLAWPSARVAALREAALLHDVGKIGVPEDLLTAPRPLTDAEEAQMREHVDIGTRILAEALSAEQVSWVRGHHERWDGNGYPDGLLAEECPEGARILALADAWDVMTSDRTYPPMPRTPADAIAECRAHAGTQFWPVAVEALARLRGGG